MSSSAEILNFLKNGELRVRQGSPTFEEQYRCSHYALGILSDIVLPKFFPKLFPKNFIPEVANLAVFEVEPKLRQQGMFCHTHFKVKALLENLFEQSTSDPMTGAVVQIFLQRGILMPTSPGFEFSKLRSEGCGDMAAGVTRVWGDDL